MSTYEQAKAILAGAGRDNDAKDVAAAFIEIERILSCDEPLYQAIADCRTMRQTLTATQKRCDQLLEENRKLREGLVGPRWEGAAPIQFLETATTCPPADVLAKAIEAERAAGRDPSVDEPTGETWRIDRSRPIGEQYPPPDPVPGSSVAVTFGDRDLKPENMTEEPNGT
ncbi:MAG: hypothetical protein HOW73_47740 [Polyangiaceae bacterium]|nr:hypothetical protein [Polyangiaceae bacterium]